MFNFRKTRFKFTEYQDFTKDLKKTQNDPFSLYVDLEIDATSGSCLSYGIGIFFNPKLSYDDAFAGTNCKEDYHPLFIIKCAPSDSDRTNKREETRMKLSQNPFPQYLNPIIQENKAKLAVMESRIKNVLSGEVNAFEELLNFDISFCYFLYNAYFSKVLKLNSTLSPGLANRYRKEVPVKDCYICNFPIGVEEETGLPNPEFCRHYVRIEYMRQYQKSSNFEIDESDFVLKSMDSLRNIHKLRQFQVKFGQLIVEKTF